MEQGGADGRVRVVEAEIGIGSFYADVSTPETTRKMRENRCSTCRWPGMKVSP